jgi:hypothetical protein
MQRLIDFFDSKAFGAFVVVAVSFLISLTMGLDGWQAVVLPLGSAIAYWLIIDQDKR